MNIKTINDLLSYVESEEKAYELIYYISSLEEQLQQKENIIKELTQENLKRSDEIDKLLEIKNKALEEIGLTDEDLELYSNYDVNGIELYKILNGGKE